MSHEREARIEDAYATMKSAVGESDEIMSALERKRVRVIEDIEAIEAQLRAMPSWYDSGHEYAALANTRDRLWQFVYVLDGMIRAQVTIQDKARRAYCRVLESK